MARGSIGADKQIPARAKSLLDIPSRTPWRDLPDAHEIVTVSLVCERCEEPYKGPRPKWYVYKAQHERQSEPFVWTGFCPPCEERVRLERIAFEERTATRAKGSEDVPKGEIDLTPAQAESDGPPEGIFDKDRDEYWK